jgi:hypothetical protein
MDCWGSYQLELGGWARFPFKEVSGEGHLGEQSGVHRWRCAVDEVPVLTVGVSVGLGLRGATELSTWGRCL